MRLELPAARTIAAIIEGEGDDDFGPAGICVPTMHQTELLNAMIKLSRDSELREEMGKSGQKRVEKYYRHIDMVNRYLHVYDKARDAWLV